MTEKTIFLTRHLCVAIVLMCTVIAPMYLQDLLVSQTVNTTAIIGETVEFDCAELTKLQEQTVFEWFMNDIPILHRPKDKERISLSSDGRILTITNVTSKYNGIYKCLISNEFRSDSSTFILTVNAFHLKINKRAAINETINVGELARWNCVRELFGTTTVLDIMNAKWSKDGKPFNISKYSSRIQLQNNYLTIAVSSIHSEDQGIYVCTASNKFRIDEAVYNITVVDSPVITSYNSYNAHFTRYAGESIWWSCIINTKYAVNTLNYKWFKDDKEIQPGDQNFRFNYNHLEMEIITISFDDAGRYRCFAYNGSINGTLNRILTVLEPLTPEYYYWYTSNVTAVTGTDITLTCKSFSSVIKYALSESREWFMNGKVMDNETIMTDNKKYLNLNKIISNNAGTYECNSTNFYHTFGSNFILSVVDPKFPMKYVLVSSIIVFITLTSVTFIACYIMSLRREQILKRKLEASKLQFINGDIEKWNPELGIEEQAELLPYDKQWEFPMDKLKLEKKLGSGAFGVVFKAEAIGIIRPNITSTVAVKMIKPDSESFYTKALISELKIMIHIGTHLNVVNLLGACTEDISKNLMVIVEYCRFGNIHDYLLKQRDYFINQITPDSFFDFSVKTTSNNAYYENMSNQVGKCDSHSTSVDSQGYLVSEQHELFRRNDDVGNFNSTNNQPLCTHDLLCWSFQVACGMEYLASRKILHGDLATRNILLADDNIVKICDFGFSKTMHNSDIYEKSSGGPLPVKWMAIESLRDRVFSTQSDVWSFGIVLWEIFSLAVTPYPNITSCNDLYERLVNGYRMEQPKYANPKLHKIMLDCWRMNPMFRPSFTNLAGCISELLPESSQSHYVALNETYVRMSTKKSPSADYINMLTTPTNAGFSHTYENVERKEKPEFNQSHFHNKGSLNVTKF